MHLPVLLQSTVQLRPRVTPVLHHRYRGVDFQLLGVDRSGFIHSVIVLSLLAMQPSYWFLLFDLLHLSSQCDGVVSELPKILRMLLEHLLLVHEELLGCSLHRVVRNATALTEKFLLVAHYSSALVAALLTESVVPSRSHVR